MRESVQSHSMSPSMTRQGAHPLKSLKSYARACVPLHDVDGEEQTQANLYFYNSDAQDWAELRITDTF